MVYGYTRVSGITQEKLGNSLEAQKTEILTKYNDARIISDTQSGKNDIRGGLNFVLDNVKEGDILAVSKLDRLSRSIMDGPSIISKLLHRGVIVDILNLGLVDNSPNGKLMLNMLFTFAQFEREMIIQRTSEGRAIARTKPNYKEGRPLIDEKKLRPIINMINSGELSLRKAALIAGVSVSTIKRRVKLWRQN